jgi:dTDP-4-amino-4,6-dideoxygalactose transaminase
MDPNLIEARITKLTKAILPVHLYGQPCDMTRIIEIADKHGLYVVEDNAQAHLAKWEGKLTGTFGNINATSFYPSKNLGAIGDGGGLTTQDEALAVEAKVFRNYGSEKKYYNKIKGVNSRLDELQAAILRIKLPYLNRLTQLRRMIANRYEELLSDCIDIKLPYVDPKAEHVFHLYVIQCEKRNEMQQYLSKNDISTMIHYPVPPHLQHAYLSLGFKEGDFPIAEKLAKTSLSLPMFPGMTDIQINIVASHIKRFFQE